MKALIALLKDENQTEFVVTVSSKPETAETERLVARLRRIEIPVHRMLINKVTPRNECNFCQLNRREELENLGGIYDEFSDLIVGEMPLFPHEIQGVGNLTEVSVDFRISS